MEIKELLEEYKKRRLERIIQGYEMGKTLRKIADEVGLSYERVRQIYREYQQQQEQNEDDK